ncbi:MAG: hypothetical protein N2035_02145 [Chthoniobacterales bacterium]|nr:hypothetical protein [Chthoniobacterales bacterium]
MRNAFAKEVTLLANQDENIILLSGDIGNKLFDELRNSHPNRFYNCGVAEANMIGVAAGLAMCGFRPICYTIAPFLTYRVIEQIRVDLCYHFLSVLLVGTGAGLAYASLGPTHHSCEEVGMLRLLPDIRIFAPADSIELRAILRYCINKAGPKYMRIGKKGEPDVHTKEIKILEEPTSFLLRQGKDVAILACGSILSECLNSAELLEKKGLQAEIWSCPCIKPLDEKLLDKVFKTFSTVVTVEEHSYLGGFGSAVAEWLCKMKIEKPKLITIGTPDEFYHEIADQHLARKNLGIDAESITSKILKNLN